MFKPFPTVSRESKPFSDLLAIWRSRETLNDRKSSHESSHAAQLPNRRPRTGNSLLPKPTSHATILNFDGELSQNISENQWKSETGLTDGEVKHGFVRETSALGRLPAETVSLSSFRSLNRNIDYLARNRHAVSTQTMCQDEAQAKDKGGINNNEGTTIKRKDTDRQSIVSNSPTHNNQSSYIRRPSCKTKQLSNVSGKRSSFRRKHNKPKSESGNEMALSTRASTPTMKENVHEANSEIERNRSLSVSKQSLCSSDDEDYVFEKDVRSDRSLGLTTGACRFMILKRKNWNCSQMSTEPFSFIYRHVMFIAANMLLCVRKWQIMCARYFQYVI